MSQNTITKAWGALILNMIVVQSLCLGYSLAESDWQLAVMNGIFLAFWIFGIIQIHLMAMRDQKSDMETEVAKEKLKNSLEGLLESIKKHHDHDDEKMSEEHQKLSDIFDKIFDSVIGDPEKATEESLAEVRQRFVKKTGHDVKLKKYPFGIDVRIAKEPIEKVTEKKGK